MGGEDNVEVVLSLDEAPPELTLLGGKGINLVRLLRAGYAVPHGFAVTTRAHDTFVNAVNLPEWIGAQLAGAALDDPTALDQLSTRIRARFSPADLPAPLANAIVDRYRARGAPGVAVRSSATAEDLPDLSFAGQQDTFLNVQGDEALLEAVVACWSSLWTARAIGYRTRNGIDHRQVSMAVVVQKMVESEVSGVLFSANPLNGRRTETVIDATLGLGEALVAGLVEPDHYVVETRSGRILTRHLGAKATVIHSAPGGGTTTEAGDGTQRQALEDDDILHLARLGQRVSAHFGSPQDIEWAYANGGFQLLQTRPITSLYPLPQRGDADDLHLFFSFGAVQGVLEPLTPLGQETFKLAAAGGARLFGLHYDRRTQPVAFSAGERLWLDMTGLVRNGWGRRMILKAIGVLEPGSGEGLSRLLAEEPRLAPRAARPSRPALLRMRPLLGRAASRLVAGLVRPDPMRRTVQQEIETAITEFRTKMDRTSTLAERIALHEQFCQSIFYLLLPRFLPPILTGYLALNLLLRLGAKLAAVDGQVDEQTALALTRGLPFNVTTEMDLSLWRTASAIRRDPEAALTLREGTPALLAERYLESRLPSVLQEQVALFLERYGMRGPGEIDFGRPRWRENPQAIFATLQSYLAIDDEAAAPDAVFRRGEQAAQAAAVALSQAAGRVWGEVGAGAIRWLVRRVRALAGLREAPKFTIIRLMDISRRALLASGHELVQKGVLERPDDLFFLYPDELQVLAMDAPGDWRRLVGERRARYDREMGRQRVPRLLLSDGTAIYAGMATPAESGEGVLVGSPVSPGTVEGTVRVVLSPHGADLQPGEILVCPGTDPAWTPLFLAAAGLVTEVGGLMTHGSVVAREYGIPAVVGVDQATRRLVNGQRVRLDGSRGQIVLL